MPDTTVTTSKEVPLEHLEHEICELSAHLSAAMCRWLLLVAEFDRREGWSGWGLRSCAHWLNWKCGLSLVCARQQLRVAHRLCELPLVRDAFACGELSYSKVRALTRMATPATESELVELARHATAAHLERIAGARRSVSSGDGRSDAKSRHDARHVHYFWDDDGSLVITARLDPEEGALVLQSLDAAGHALRDSAESSAEAETRDSAESSAEAETRDSAESSAEAAQRNAAASRRPADRADALVAMAETMLEHGPAARDGGERYQVVVLIDADALAGGHDGRCQVEGGPRLARDTALRMACDSAVVAMSMKNGEPLDVGRSTKAIPRAIRRALRVRDGGCRFPGCTQDRYVDGHHIVHWAQGGDTSLANLVLLCRFHHHRVHEGGYGLVRTAEGELIFTTPAGAVVAPVPEPEPAVELDVDAVNKRLGVVITSGTGASLWGGERLDLGLAIDALLCLERRAT